jgi:hypothetical protein
MAPREACGTSPAHLLRFESRVQVQHDLVRSGSRFIATTGKTTGIDGFRLAGQPPSCISSRGSQVSDPVRLRPVKLAWLFTM